MYFYEGILHEDEEWVPRVFMNAKSILYNNSLLYVYRINRKGSITNTLNIKKIIDRLKIIKLLQSEFQKSKYSNEVERIILVRIQTILFTTFIEVHKYQNFSEYKEICRSIYNEYAMMKKSSHKSFVVSYYMIHVIGISKASKLMTQIIRLKNKRLK